MRKRKDKESQKNLILNLNLKKSFHHKNLKEDKRKSRRRLNRTRETMNKQSKNSLIQHFWRRWTSLKLTRTMKSRNDFILIKYSNIIYYSNVFKLKILRVKHLWSYVYFCRDEKNKEEFSTLLNIINGDIKYEGV